MNLLQHMTDRARQRQRRVVLPEGTELRTLRAANRILAEGLAQVTLIGNPDEIRALAAENGFEAIAANAAIVNPADSAVIDRYAPILFELRKAKGMTPEQARITAANELYLGCLIIKAGDGDCMVAGADNTTGDVLRAAFQVIKTAPGISSVSGAFLMVLPEGSPYGSDGVMVFADCAVIPDPTPQELAEIAVGAAQTARNIAGIEPRVAMLTYSTFGSGKGERVDKVVEAVKIAREMDPTICLDGELQADAALVPVVAQKKAPNSPVAGKANVLVFPSLEVGNIAYKLVQRLAGAQAIGPVLQGLGAPINDLSRGASWEEIYKTIIMTCNQ